MRITIVSFSGRAEGSCEGALRVIEQFHRAETVTVYRFSEIDITPCGRCGYECFENRESCPHGGDPENAICGDIAYSDLVFFIIPNYCDYPCSNYFVFNERSLSFFQGRAELLERYLRVRKKFIVISNTERDNFKSILSQQTLGEPDILFLSGSDYGLSSTDGRLFTSPGAAERLRGFLMS